MAPLKRKGDLAELKVATDLIDRGYGVAIPFGEDCDFDLIAHRGDELHRVQVKYTRSNGSVIALRCRSHSLTNGRIRQTKRYTAATIDWLAAYDPVTERCYYVNARELGLGRSVLHLRHQEPRNGQHVGIRYAEDYLTFGDDPSAKPALFE